MSSRMKDKTLPRLTPAIAKVVWQAQHRPSARRVATALHQAGYAIHYTTINRWRSQGWREVKQGEHPILAARAALDSAVPILTGDPSATAEDVIKHSNAKPELEQLSDKQLLSAAARQALVILTIVEQQSNAHVAELLMTKPRELGVLIKAMADMCEAATGAFREVHRLPTD
jgi:hypothetical protein